MMGKHEPIYLRYPSTLDGAGFFFELSAFDLFLLTFGSFFFPFSTVA